jgi:hypothetical protein
VEWSDWTLSFSKYTINFRSNIQGAETLLTHFVKVQFLDLYDQFHTTKTLTIMASSIGEMLEIESPDSYIKRLAGPTITIKVKDISKLAGIIRIPSMAEGMSVDDMIAQRILYFGLSNQCRKCKRFDCLAKSCKLNRPSVQGGNIPLNNPPAWSKRAVLTQNASA